MRFISFAELEESKKKKREEGMWHSLEKEDRLVTSIGDLHISTRSKDIRSEVYKPPVNALWDHIETPTHDYDVSSGKPAFKAQYGIEEAERAIIENLEREERERQLKETADQDEYIDPWKVHNIKPRRINKISTFESNSTKIENKYGTAEEERMSSRQQSTVISDKGNESKMKSWKSLEHFKVFSGLAQEITEQVSKDAEWSPPVVHSSWRFFDLDTEQRRMEEYDREQEKKRQVTILSMYQIPQFCVEIKKHALSVQLKYT